MLKKITSAEILRLRLFDEIVPFREFSYLFYTHVIVMRSSYSWHFNHYVYYIS